MITEPRRPSRNYAALEMQRAMLERSLADLKSGKNVSHLTDQEVCQFADDLKKRLATIDGELRQFKTSHRDD